jgi:hypothetical protein
MAPWTLSTERAETGESPWPPPSAATAKKNSLRRGDAIYESEIRPGFKSADEGKFVAIDIESGLYELDHDELQACHRLRARVPEAQIWMVRVGYRSVHRFGGRDQQEAR